MLGGGHIRGCNIGESEHIIKRAHVRPQQFINRSDIYVLDQIQLGEGEEKLVCMSAWGYGEYKSWSQTLPEEGCAEIGSIKGYKALVDLRENWNYCICHYVYSIMYYAV